MDYNLQRLLVECERLEKENTEINETLAEWRLKYS